MPTDNCLCHKQMQAVFGELMVALDRIDHIHDSEVKKYMEGYRNGVMAAERRYRMTANKCCCERSCVASAELKKDGQ